jgi:hypothetical protein
MSKQTKFKLEELKVESFLTRLEDEKKDKVKGGCEKTHVQSGCLPTYGCTVSDNPIACCIPPTFDCTHSGNPMVCCVE